MPERERERVCVYVLDSKYFEPSQLKRIISVLKTNFSVSPSFCFLVNLHTSNQTKNFLKSTKSVMKEIYITQNIHTQT